MIKFEADSGFPCVVKLLRQETINSNIYYAIAEGTDVNEVALFILKQIKTTGWFIIVDSSIDNSAVSNPVGGIILNGNQWEIITLKSPLPIQLSTFQLDGVDYVGYVVIGQH